MKCFILSTVAFLLSIGIANAQVFTNDLNISVQLNEGTFSISGYQCHPCVVGSESQAGICTCINTKSCPGPTALQDYYDCVTVCENTNWPFPEDEEICLNICESDLDQATDECIDSCGVFMPDTITRIQIDATFWLLPGVDAPPVGNPTVSTIRVFTGSNIPQEQIVITSINDFPSNPGTFCYSVQTTITNSQGNLCVFIDQACLNLY